MSASRCWSTTSPTCSRWTRGRPGARSSAAATRGSSPLFEDGWLYEGLVAEHGFSVLVTVERGGAQRRILFDAGLSPDALVTNMRRMGLDRVTSRSSCSATGTPTTPPAWTASSAP